MIDEQALRKKIEDLGIKISPAYPLDKSKFT
jgi:hypothetical protein